MRQERPEAAPAAGAFPVPVPVPRAPAMAATPTTDRLAGASGSAAAAQVQGGSPSGLPAVAAAAGQQPASQDGNAMLVTDQAMTAAEEVARRQTCAAARGEQAPAEGADALPAPAASPLRMRIRAVRRHPAAGAALSAGSGQAGVVELQPTAMAVGAGAEQGPGRQQQRRRWPGREQQEAEIQGGKPAASPGAPRAPALAAPLPYSSVLGNAGERF